MAKPLLQKVVDEEDQVRCRSGSYGVLREEVFVDAAGAVVRYNLAFIHFGLCQRDNGRVLGYDNAHGQHERHWMGRAEPVECHGYDQILKQFISQVAILKEQA